jgi:hypothetical protein
LNNKLTPGLTEEEIVERATPGTHVTADESQRRVRSQFEDDLIAQHVRATRKRQLWTGLVLLGLAALLAWKLWG